MKKQTHWKKRFVVALTGGFLALHTVAGFAAPVELSLEESIAMALKNNPAIKMADEDRKNAKFSIDAAQGAKSPRLSLVHTDSRSSSTSNAFTPGNLFTNAIKLNMNLYSGGKAESDVEKAKIGLKSADLDVEKSKQKVKLDATNGYFGILAAKNKVKVSQESVDQSQDHLKNVQAQYAVGTVAKSEVLRSQVELASNQQALIVAQNALELAVSTLNNVIGLPLETEIKVKDELKHEKYNLSMEECIKYAMIHRPEAIQADYAIDIAKQGVKGARSGNLPSIDASAAKNWKDSKFPGTENDGWSVGLTATWTPFDSGVTKAEIRQADTTVARSIEAARQSKDTIQLEVRQAYLNMNEAEKRIDTSQVAVEQAEEDFKIAEVRYSAGVGTNIDVIDAQVTLTKQKNSYIQAMYDFNTSKANLNKAMGVSVL